MKSKIVLGIGCFFQKKQSLNTYAGFYVVSAGQRV